MKRAIYIMFVGVVSFVFVSCREKQIYTQREILTMQKYAEELATYMIKDTTGIHVPLIFYELTFSKIKDTVSFWNSENFVENYVHECGIGMSGYNAEDKYGDFIVDGIGLSASYQGEIYEKSKHYSKYTGIEYYDSCNSSFYIRYHIELNRGKLYIEYYDGRVQTCKSNNYFSNKNTNFSLESPDSLTITGTGDNSNFKMVFKKNVGLVYVRDTANNTWTLVK